MHTINTIHAHNSSCRYTQANFKPAQKHGNSLQHTHTSSTGWANCSSPVVVPCDIAKPPWNTSTHPHHNNSVPLAKGFSAAISCFHGNYKADVFVFLNESFYPLPVRRKSNTLQLRDHHDCLKSLLLPPGKSHTAIFSFKKDHQLASLGKESGNLFTNQLKRTNRYKEVGCESSLWRKN